MKILKKENLIIFILLLILNLISLFNMINSKLISDVYKNAFIKQLFWFLIGYIIIFICQKLKIKIIFKYSKSVYLLSLFLLILVLFVGKDINGAKCWINIFGFSFQPSEIMKLSLLLYLLEIIEKNKIKSLKDEFLMLLKIICLTLIPSILVFLEPDTGAIINYLIILIVVIFSLKLNKWWYISFFGSLIFVLAVFFALYFFEADILIKIIGTSFFYRMDRLINFASGNSYQLENALITIGSATFFGTGLNKILLYIPEAPTDFFFAFSIGNFGLFSALIILISFLVIDIFLIYKAHKLKIYKYQIFSFSYLAIFIFHQIYNIGMNLGLLPIMGIPLPFLSYGGTNTLINYLFISLIINMNNKK